MGFELMPSPAQLTASANDLATANPAFQKYGLFLTPAQAAMLVNQRQIALRETGRVEFDGEGLKKLALTFCDSPYIQSPDWADTLARLQEIFYQLKNETCDRLGDDELLCRMAERFNGSAGGSLDALEATPAAWFLRPGEERVDDEH